MAQPATLGRPTSALLPAVRVALWPALIVTALAAGLVLRIWILASPLGTLESDEAIPGLMARHALDGEFSVFYWLNLYGGTQEALVTAAVFAVTGSSVLALKTTAIALYAVAGGLLWLVGRRTVGERAAWLGVVLFWLSPAYFVWWTTKSRGFYALGLVCALAVLLLVLRLRERESRLDAAALGFVLGFGVWNSLQFLLAGLPALAWLAWRRPGAYRLWWLPLPAFVIGAAPWLAWNAVNDWKAVVPRAVAGADTSYFERFVDLFHYVLPTWLGVRVPYSLDWLPGPVLGVAVVALVITGFILLLVRRPPGLELLLVVGAVFPFLYAASSFTYFVAEPRYLVYLAPVTALLGGWAAARWRPALALVPLALALTVAGLVRMERQALFQPIAQDARVPADMAPLLDLLEREGVDRVLANYWIAYRLSFESAERVIATSTGFVRYEPHDRLVRSSPHPARVFVDGSSVERAARADLEARGFERREAGGWVLYVHAQG